MPAIYFRDFPKIRELNPEDAATSACYNCATNNRSTSIHTYIKSSNLTIKEKQKLHIFTLY
jgi:hypothetical protein